MRLQHYLQDTLLFDQTCNLSLALSSSLLAAELRRQFPRTRRVGMMSLPSFPGWESTAWTANGLLTPPAFELELSPESILSHKEEPYDYRLGVSSNSRCSPKKARYHDFLGAGPGLPGSDLDSDPDLVTMRELKNKYSKAATISKCVCLPSARYRLALTHFPLH